MKIKILKQGGFCQLFYFAEVWISLQLLELGDASRLLEEGFARELKPKVERACKAVADERAIGAELTWGDKAGAEALRALPSSADGKQFYVAWLKERYGYNIVRLNQSYRLEATSFTDLAESDFKTLQRELPAVVADDKDFLIYLEESFKQKVDEMFQACAAGRKTAWKRSRT